MNTGEPRVNTAGPTQTGDLCLSDNDVTPLPCGSVTTKLVDDPTNGWHAKADNGDKTTYEIQQQRHPWAWDLSDCTALETVVSEHGREKYSMS